MDLQWVGAGVVAIVGGLWLYFKDVNNKLSKSYDDRLTEAANAFNAQVASLKESFSQRLSEITASHERRLTDMEKSYESRLADQDKYHEQIRTEWQAQMVETRKERDAARADVSQLNTVVSNNNDNMQRLAELMAGLITVQETTKRSVGSGDRSR